MTPNIHDDIVIASLGRIESTLSDHTERLTRVETLVDERTTKIQQRRELVSRGAWTTVVSGAVVGVWEVIKMKWASK